MTCCVLLSVALLLASPSAAQDQVDPPSAPAGDTLSPVIDSQSAPQEFDLAKKRVVNCEGEKFVFTSGEGAQPTTVTLCSKEGATLDEIVQMLNDAATKIAATSIAEDRRVAIVQQIRSKISELQGAYPAAPVPAPTAEPAAASEVAPIDA